MRDLDTAIRCELAEYLGYDYATDTPPVVAQPSALVPASVVWKPGRKTDTVCSVLIAGVLGRVFPTVWPAGSYALIQVPVDRPWGLIDAVVAAGHGREVAQPFARTWHVWQGWTALDAAGRYVPNVSKGHQGFLAPDGRLLEATTWTDEDGDGKSTDPGAVAWRLRAWPVHVARYDRVRLVELFEPPAAP